MTETPNIENLNKMIDTFKQLYHAPIAGHENKGFSMSVPGFDQNGVDQSGHNCGTAACILGWQSVIGLRIGLDVSSDLGDALFCPTECNGCKYNFVFHEEKFTLPAAIAVLELLRDTGKVDWNYAIEHPWKPEEKPKIDWAKLIMLGGLDGLPEGPKRTGLPAPSPVASQKQGT